MIALALLIAAGGVVDVSVGSEVRASQNDVHGAGDVDATVAQGGLVLRPAIAAAVQNEMLAGTLKYSPGFSLLTPLADPSQAAFSILHGVDAGGDVRLGERVSMRGSVGLSIGDLDPASAQSQLRTSSGVLDPLTAFPYAGANAKAGASFDVTRHFGFDVDAAVDVSTSLGADEIPLTISPSLEAFAFWDLTRADRLFGGAHAEGSTVEGRGSFIGGGPEMGWRHALGRDTGFSLSAGVGSYTADDDEELESLVVFLPRARGSINTVQKIAGDTALEAGAQGGVSVRNDPLGTLFENRASAGLTAGLRITRDLVVREETDLFAPAFVYAQRGPTSSTTLGTRTLVAWAPIEHLALETSLITSTRVVEKDIGTDLLFGISVSGSMALWHTGGRPRGTNGNFDVGVTQVGAAPPAGMPTKKTIEEPKPLEIPPEEPLPPELVPPSGMVSPDALVDPNTPGALRVDLRPMTDEAKKKAEEAKKKRRDGKDAKGDEKDADAPDAKSSDVKSDDAKSDAKDDAKSDAPATP